MGALAIAGALVLSALAAGPAAARTLDYWVAAVPTSWSIVPNGHDAISGMTVAVEDSVFPTVVYRRFTPHWRRPLANAPRSAADGLLIPGPLLHARAGDRLRIHFKNMDTLRREPHSMHFHGVHYPPSSDGAYVPGVSGGDADVKVGRTWTYRLTAGADSVGLTGGGSTFFSPPPKRAQAPPAARRTAPAMTRGTALFLGGRGGKGAGGGGAAGTFLIVAPSSTAGGRVTVAESAGAVAAAPTRSAAARLPPSGKRSEGFGAAARRTMAE